MGLSNASPADIERYQVYFSPDVLVGGITLVATGRPVPGSVLGAFLVEAAKWCIVLAIAVWLTIAQLASPRRGKGRLDGKSEMVRF